MAASFDPSALTRRVQEVITATAAQMSSEAMSAQMRPTRSQLVSEFIAVSLFFRVVDVAAGGRQRGAEQAKGEADGLFRIGEVDRRETGRSGAYHGDENIEDEAEGALFGCHVLGWVRC